MTNPNANDLIKQGIALYKKGDKLQAGRQFYQATQADPTNQIAWLWLAGCVDEEQDQRMCFEKVIAINSQSEAGQQAAKERAKLGEENELPPPMTKRSSQGQTQKKRRSRIGCPTLILLVLASWAWWTFGMQHLVLKAAIDDTIAGFETKENVPLLITLEIGNHVEEFHVTSWWNEKRTVFPWQDIRLTVNVLEPVEYDDMPNCFIGERHFDEPEDQDENRVNSSIGKRSVTCTYNPW